MNSSRKHWTLTALLLTSVFAWALSGCGTSGSKQPAAGDAAAPAQGAGQTSEAKTTLEPKLRIGYISPNNKGTITGVEGWAQKKGYLESELKKYGVTDVSVKSFPNGPNLNEALASGALDVGIYGDTPAINARAVGLKTKLINITQSGMNAWLVAKADGPQKVEDLKGKKIATADGSYMSRYLKGLLQEKGLDKDIKVVHLLPADGEAALARGDIEAYAYPTGFGPLIISKGYKAIDEAKSHPDLRGSSVTVASEDYLSRNPGFVQVWNGVRQKAAKEIQSNADEFYKLYAESSEFPLDVVKASFDISQWQVEDFSADSLKLLEGTKKYLFDNGIIKKDFNLNDWIYKP
ncbi:ABC transporter substrate-binding protein [Paenibacillus validus]|uniref:PhnD/SsuA/transferrin family substrate-binding protein n=1 Tax=Paenibacillus validus TaxID=44253 RepID=A0A7X2ZAK6_9BACL|nr:MULTISPECIES: ABC transporter substrate-binding protein [Paenibacillus]MED4601714.1 ABC transporter substrate-binding protein [Paenibacillus validus]MED4608746.1 ABC transporter substrate-binding protein [Paenibacillus validus]MUG71388.1 PhnD/SsuA/transferrin family substrate-binding protein [Paenibacillus validus]